MDVQGSITFASIPSSGGNLFPVTGGVDSLGCATGVLKAAGFEDGNFFLDMVLCGQVCSMGNNEPSDDACCSIDFKTCGGGCDDQSICGQDINGCLDRIYLPNGDLTGCIPRWTGGCEQNSDCCPGLYCDTSNPFWQSCQFVPN